MEKLLMNTSNPQTPKKSTGSAGLKTVITVFSLTGILLLWNLYADNGFGDSILSFLNSIIPGQAPANTALNDPPMPVLDPLPTLVQLKSINLVVAPSPVQNSQPAAARASAPVVAGQAAAATDNPVSTLRVVSAPSIDSIVQVVKPKIDLIDTSGPADTASNTAGGGVHKHKSKSS
jgi:hypothetical protein